MKHLSVLKALLEPGKRTYAVIILASIIIIVGMDKDWYILYTFIGVVLILFAFVDYYLCWRHNPSSIASATSSTGNSSPSPYQEAQRLYGQKLHDLSLEFEEDNWAKALRLKRMARTAFGLAGEPVLAADIEREISEASPELEIPD